MHGLLNPTAIVAELRWQEQTELLPPPEDVVFGSETSPPSKHPASKPKPAEFMPPRFSPDLSYLQNSGNNSRSRRGAFDRGDDVDEGGFD